MLFVFLYPWWCPSPVQLITERWRLNSSTIILGLSIFPLISISLHFYFEALLLTYIFKVVMSSWCVYSFIIIQCPSFSLIVFPHSEVYFDWYYCRFLSFLLMSVFFLSFFYYLFISFIFIFWLCWVFVSVRGLPLVAASGGHSSLRCAGLSLSWPLLLQSTASRRAGSVVVAHGPSCSAACGIFPDQGSNPCPLH